MTTWTLIILLTSGSHSGNAAFTVPGFSSYAACAEAGAEVEKSFQFYVYRWRCVKVK